MYNDFGCSQHTCSVNVLFYYHTREFYRNNSFYKERDLVICFAVILHSHLCAKQVRKASSSICLILEFSNAFKDSNMHYTKGFRLYKL